ncbi:MAG: zinc-ribbon domain-containing protein [Suilimivivens sp.]
MVKNNLLKLRPDLAIQWDYKRNYPLRPEDVTLGSNKKVWWILPYDDPRTGKHFDFSWQSRIGSRVRDNLGCPYLSNQKIWQGFNDLASYPEYEYLVKQWHPYKNGNLTPYNVSSSYDNPVWWILPYDDPRTTSETVSKSDPFQIQ